MVKKRKNILSKNKTNDFKSLFPRYIYRDRQEPEALIGQPMTEGFRRVTFVTLIYVLLSPKISSLAVFKLDEKSHFLLRRNI